MYETRNRTIVKAISWRIVAVLITSTIVFITTKEIKLATSIGIIDTIIKLGIYFFHERTWLKIPYGKVPPPEYRI